MPERLTNDEREALIAGDRAGALEGDAAAELPLLAELLADRSTWVEPDAGLEDTVVTAVAGAKPATTRSHRRAAPPRRRIVQAVAAAAAAIAIVVGIVVATRGGTSADFKAQLTATSLAPGARASADITRNGAGFRITLDAHGLRALVKPGYYQAWLKNAAGTLVPIGTFSSSDGRVTLWSGVSPKDFPTITVTIEQADNAQASSGRRVLVGEVQSR